MMNKQKRQVIGAWLLGALFLVVSACANQSQNESTDDSLSTDSAGLTDSVIADTVISKFTDQETIRVVAGNSIGDFLIGQEVEESNLFNRLGEVDSADAAMCKSWSMWYFDDEVNEAKREFDLYSACDVDIDMRKSTQVMRLGNIDFELDNGISLGDDLSVLKESYPNAIELTYTDASNGEIIQVFDDIAEGIAFEVSNGVVRAVIVHVPDQSIENMYLPFYQQ
ncbi:hypothetical protein [Albibacterium indicum]|uniref:hypothetical protein n=1 Tax=Albibacterium indicum TaxID=2292082 RepID=UPI0013001EF7|nr:hypothetical protein [Pedobacter indicus]